MTLEEHEEYLDHLQGLLDASGDDGFGLAICKREGAFYFGEGISFAEYVELYEKAIEDEVGV